MLFSRLLESVLLPLSCRLRSKQFCTIRKCSTGYILKIDLPHQHKGLQSYLGSYVARLCYDSYFFFFIGTSWTNKAVIGTSAVCIPLIAVLQSRFNRLEIDRGVRTQIYAENVVIVPEQNMAVGGPLLQHEVAGVSGSGADNPVLSQYGSDIAANLNIPEQYGSQEPLLKEY